MKILVINAGSSSLKYQFIDMDSSEVLAKGICERIGIDGSITHKTSDGRVYQKNADQPSHKNSIELVVRLLTDKEYGVIGNINEIAAIGHRAVHGGNIKESKIINDDLMDYLDTVEKLAPLHNPPLMAVIRICRSMLGDIPQVAVFDTAFHAAMPPHAYMFPIPYELYEEHQIRKYGFHGTSHKYVSKKAASYLHKDIRDLKIVSCHLGNGSSITAVKDGISIDTTMGFTPLDGLIMGTRCGSIDPAIVTFMVNDLGMTGAEVDTLLNKKSGLAGVSGISSDMRDLSEAAANGNERALLARNLLNYQIRKYIGSYAAAMNGVDVIIFTAGIGENSPSLREDVCKNLAFLGVELDDEKNKTRSEDVCEISTPDSKVKVLIVPTNEEYAIALDTLELVK